MRLADLLLEFEQVLEEDHEVSISRFVDSLGVEVSRDWLVELAGVYAENEFKRGRFDAPRLLKQEFPSLSDNIDKVTTAALSNFVECYCPVSDELGSLPAKSGDFHFIREIGRGGTGVVYEAKQLSLNRSVAIKVPFSPKGEVIREGKVLSRIDHRNCVAIYGLGEIGPFPFVAMQLVNGDALKKHCRTPPSLSPARTVDIMLQVLDAVAELHSRGIAHRDLKPSNVLLEEDRVLLVDFGLASRTDDTHYGLGSPGYMAPELFGESPVESLFLCDLFSLGVMLYELLTGTRPYGSSPDAIRKPPRRCRDYRPEVDEELDRICLKAVKAEPQHRFQTAQSFRDALERWANEQRAIENLPVDQSCDEGKLIYTPTRVGLLAKIGCLLTGLAVLAGVWATLVPSVTARTVTDSANVTSRLTLNAYRADVADDSLSLLGSVGHSEFVVRDGDFVTISHQSLTPTYCSLIAANTNGTLQFLAESDSKVEKFVFPEDKDYFFCLNEGKGVQAFILVRSKQPIEEWDSWSADPPSDTGWTGDSSLTGVWISVGSAVRQVSSLVERGDKIRTRNTEPFVDLIRWVEEECDGDIHSIAFQVKK